MNERMDTHIETVRIMGKSATRVVKRRPAPAEVMPTHVLAEDVIYIAPITRTPAKPRRRHATRDERKRPAPSVRVHSACSMRR